MDTAGASAATELNTYCRYQLVNAWWREPNPCQDDDQRSFAGGLWDHVAFDLDQEKRVAFELPISRSFGSVTHRE